MDIKEKLKEAMKVSLKELGFHRVETQLEHPENANHGDYSSNIAMTIFSNAKIKSKNSKVQLKIQRYKNSLELAEEIKLRIENLKLKILDKVETAAPGFINFWLSKELLSRQLELALRGGERYPSTSLRTSVNKNKTVVVEYSSPNIAKRFGIGHLRSTIIGQTIYNLYQFLGYKTISDNHLGDWGTQFGAIVYQIQNSKLKNITVDELEGLYVDFNQKAKENPELWEEARKWFKKLEDGDGQARSIWKACVKISLEEFDKIYKLLGVTFDNMHGESFYEDKMAAVIQELKDKKLVVEDKGALILKYPDDELTPGIVLKSDGATTYLTRDLAQVKFRLGEWDPYLLIYEVGVEQTLHFRQLFRAVDLLGWAKPGRFVHVRHGLYLSPGGKKFSTRRGETVKIEDVLTESVERASKLGNTPISEVATAVGMGAVKYFDLSHSPESDIVFSWEKMFLLTGNSGPYLQYTHARARSVLRKANLRVLPRVLLPASARFAARVSGALPPVSPANLSIEELALLRTFYKFPEVVETAAQQYSPNSLCNFLYDLASKYNLLYNNLRILKLEVGSEKLDGESKLRLGLTQVTANILKTGLGLLGIAAPEKM